MQQMPIFQSQGKLFYFAHVPKTGGTSIELYLAERFGDLWFMSGSRRAPLAVDSWSATSPQHIETAVLDSLISPDWFEASFTIVRDPISRLRSSYAYNNRNKSAWRRPGFERWVQRALRNTRKNPRYKDNHMRPQTDLIPTTAQVFRFEDGLERIIPFLDKVTQTRADDIALPFANKRTTTTENTLNVSPKTLDTIVQFYERDYARFGYMRPTNAAA